MLIISFSARLVKTIFLNFTNRKKTKQLYLTLQCLGMTETPFWRLLCLCEIPSNEVCRVVSVISPARPLQW